MRKTTLSLMGLIFVGLTSSVYAGDNTSGSQSGAWSQSGVNIQNQAGHKPVGAAIAPGLIAGGITCLGSWSIGSGWSGFGGSTGMTYPDRYCNAREDAKYMLLIGASKQAAKERLCDIAQVRNAYAAAGEPCLRDQSQVRTSAKTTTTFGYSTAAGYSKTSGKVGKSPRAQ